jgi:hypothetical protein
MAAKAARKAASVHTIRAEWIAERNLQEAQEYIERHNASYERVAYDRLLAGRVDPALLAEYEALAEQEDGSDAKKTRVMELAAVIEAAVSESEVRHYLVDVFGFGRSDEWAIPTDIIWPALDLCDPDALQRARSVGAATVGIAEGPACSQDA